MVKLGRKPSPADRRTFSLGEIVSITDVRPKARDWSFVDLDRDGVREREITFEMFGNLNVGCCTVSAIAHHEQMISWLHEMPARLDTAGVLQIYRGSGWDGVPNSDTDQGWSCLEALRAARSRAVIQGFAAVEPIRSHIEATINMFGGCYLGFDLPRAWQRARVWDVAGRGEWTEEYRVRSWGGHAVVAVGYDRLGVWIVTWGRLQYVTWAAVAQYAPERWAAFNTRWMRGKFSPSGFDQTRLDRALARL